MKISPSISSSNLLNIGDELKKLECHYQDIHIDIEDGNFVPNITFGNRMVMQIRTATDLPFSVHLMVTNPLDYIYMLSTQKCNVIFIHVEASMYIMRYVNLIHKLGMKVGIAFNPITPIESYEYLFDKVDAILIMTSEPDYAGERFISSMLQKIIDVRNKFGGELWCDGGIDTEMLEKLEKINVDVCVMGRAIFKNKER